MTNRVSASSTLTCYSKLLTYLSEPREMFCAPARILQDEKLVKQVGDKWQTTAKGKKLAA